MQALLCTPWPRKQETDKRRNGLHKKRRARSIASKLAVLAMAVVAMSGCAGSTPSQYPDPSGAPAGFADKLCAAVASIDRVQGDIHDLVLAGTELPAIAKVATTLAEHIDATDAILVATPDWAQSGDRIAEWRPLMAAESENEKALAAAAATGSMSELKKAIRARGKESLGFDVVHTRMREYANHVGIECAPVPSRAPVPSAS
jgi:hypothetical protein